MRDQNRIDHSLPSPPRIVNRSPTNSSDSQRASPNDNDNNSTNNNNQSSSTSCASAAAVNVSDGPLPSSNNGNNCYPRQPMSTNNIARSVRQRASIRNGGDIGSSLTFGSIVNDNHPINEFRQRSVRDGNFGTVQRGICPVDRHLDMIDRLGMGDSTTKRAMTQLGTVFHSNHRSSVE